MVTRLSVASSRLDFHALILNNVTENLPEPQPNAVEEESSSCALTNGEAAKRKKPTRRGKRPNQKRREAREAAETQKVQEDGRPDGADLSSVDPAIATAVKRVDTS